MTASATATDGALRIGRRVPLSREVQTVRGEGRRRHGLEHVDDGGL